MSLQRFIFVGLLAAWIAAIGFGLSRLWAYASVPAPASPVAAVWPPHSRVARAPDVPTLVLFAHPKCPCSRASIGELARVMAHIHGRVETVVLFYRPANADPGWEKTDLWDAAAAIPSVRVMSDQDGAEGQTFGVLASGHTLLYGADRELLFSGGITAARGHAGDSAGSRSIVALALGAGPAVPKTSVFGCFLRAIDGTLPTPSQLD
jgi:hypothetical protein